MRSAILILTAALILAACSRPTDALIPTDMATWDKELAPLVKKLSDEEKELFAAYLMRAKMGEVLGGKGIPPGTTVGQAIDNQKKWMAEREAKQAEEKALKQKLEAERAVVIEQLNKAVTVTLLAKRQLPSSYDSGRYSEYQEFRIGAKNNSDKQLIGVAGTIKFIDVFDKEVGAVSFKISEEIAPGKTVTWVGGRDYNKFIEAHRAVWSLDDGKYTTRFIPEMLVFKDGTKLAVPQ